MQPLNGYQPHTPPVAANMMPTFPNPHQQSSLSMGNYGRPMARNPSYTNTAYPASPAMHQSYPSAVARPIPSPSPQSRMSMPSQQQYATHYSQSPSPGSSRRGSAQGGPFAGSYPQNGMSSPRTGNQSSGAIARTNSRSSMLIQPGTAASMYHQPPLPTTQTSSSYFPQGSATPGPDLAHHSSSSPTHAPDDCPGCIADYHAALRASEASALEETRLREQRLLEEEEHWKAMRASEDEEKRQREAEEAELRQVMEASRADEEAAGRRRLEKQREDEEHRKVLLEESRQSALREDEERIRRAHAELFERSKREAEELSKRRKMEAERMQALEVAAVEESRRELEQEWRRRDEEERAQEEFAQQGGKQGEAAYWQHVSDEQAYDLAVEMNRTLSFGNEGTSSSRLSRRPLPPTPGLAALAAGVEESSPRTDTSDDWDHADEDSVEESDGDDPFGDQAEALPSYDDVRTDRPPEAPQEIPDHVQFARPPPASASSVPSNTLILPFGQSEKTPASVITTPRASLRDLPVPPVASGSLLPPADIHSRQPARVLEEGVSPPPSHTLEVQTSPSSPLAVPSILLSRVDTRSTTSTIQNARGQPQSLPQIVETPSPPAESTSSRNSLQQRAMKGTDFGYSYEPFAPDLRLQDGGRDKKHFPGAVQIKATKSDGSLREGQAYFTIRAHSWKMLLRALAWYGNTRLEAGAEEVVDASSALKLRVEVEFVTPVKVEAAPGPTSVQEAYKNAHVAVCMSLIGSQSLKTSDAALASSLKQSSRSLDASYLRRGSTRRVISLPSQAPVLPLTVVRLAQHLHQAHIFSSACPSTGHTALHSPRDLTQAIERHDYNYLIKLKKKRKDVEGEEGADREAGQDQNGENSDDGIHDPEVVEAFGEEELSGAGRMSRVKAKVMRKLAGRSGDGNAVNQDLESWITPFDLSQHE